MIGATDIGFTGSRNGTTPAQFAWLNARMRGIGMLTFRHGGCVGSDEQSHYIALDYFTVYAGKLGRPIKVHPPINPRLRMELLEHSLVEYLPEFDYLTRDRHIVHAVHRMLATPSLGSPGEIVPSSASGSWYTINFALSIDRVVEICYPDGRAEVRQP